MTAEPLPDWFMPPPGGWTADDLDKLPPGTPRMELIDGALIVISPQTRFHSRVMRRLTNALEETGLRRGRCHTRDDHETRKASTAGTRRPRLPIRGRGRRTPRLVPGHPCSPEDVLIAIEVVSEESRDRDRTTKPMKYAAAGIPHFWRVERDGAGPVIHVYELDGTGEPRYVPIIIARDRLKIDRPFPIDIDVQALVD